MPRTSRWEFYRENKINPDERLPADAGAVAGVLRPVRHVAHGHRIARRAVLLWTTDLSKADTLFIIPGLSFIPFISTPEGLPFNLLPILYIATAIWQTHITPMSPGMDPTQQKMMRWMPLMFLVILYNFSSGLALYMTVNNLLTILQTKIDEEAAHGAGRHAAAPATASVLTPASKKKK